MSVPVYTSEELTRRITEGSVDTNRLAATVAGLLELETTVTALVNWVNAQIQGAADAETDADARKARKR